MSTTTYSRFFIVCANSYRLQRDQEQREALAQTIRGLRSEASQQNQKIERLETRNEDLARQLSLSQSQERSARAALRTAESSSRALREEMARLKTTVQQVRTACANDVRKRDIQLQRLKTHLPAQQRGNKTGLVGASITITPGASGMGGIGHTMKDDDSPSVDDPDYSLKQETTEFLTQLSQSLSDENDNLIGLVRSTLTTLRELQGLPESVHLAAEMERIDAESEHADSDMLHALPTSYDALASDMDTVLENLRSLLTNPNFVPIEEVEVREQQIVKLRTGWEKMEGRWREAVALMEGWRKRMLSGGDTVNLEELKIGLGLGVGIPTVNGEADLSTLSEAEEEDMDCEEPEEEEDEVAPAEQGEHEDVQLREPLGEPLEEHSQHDLRTGKSSNHDLFNLKLPRNQQPLHESDGNVRSPRKVTFISPAAASPMASARSNLDENVSEVDLIQSSTPIETAPKPQLSKLPAPKLPESRIPRQVRTLSLSSRHPFPNFFFLLPSPVGRSHARLQHHLF
jgi:hypothetical protein